MRNYLEQSKWFLTQVMFVGLIITFKFKGYSNIRIAKKSDIDTVRIQEAMKYENHKNSEGSM